MYRKFQRIIEKNKITPYRVAKDCGLPMSTLYDWKAGRSTPKTDKLQKIATYLNVSIEDLIETEKEK